MTETTPTLTDELAEMLHPWLDGAERCPYSPTTICHNHGRSRHLARALLGSPLIARMVADAEARALREAADKWQWGEWTVLTAPIKAASQPQRIIGAAQAVTDWLRDRADRRKP